jgi:hypothetical protein
LEFAQISSFPPSAGTPLDEVVLSQTVLDLMGGEMNLLRFALCIPEECVERFQAWYLIL